MCTCSTPPRCSWSQWLSQRLKFSLLLVMLLATQCWAFTGWNVQDSRQAPRSMLTQLGAQAQAPFVDKWKVLRNGSLVGRVTNHPEIADGDIITTSPLQAPKEAEKSSIVTTINGSRYRLGDPIKPVVKRNIFFQKKNGVAVMTASPPPVAEAPAKTPPKPTSSKPSAAQMRKARLEFGITGEDVGEGKYLLASPPTRSTSGKSNIYKAYRANSEGLPEGIPITVKVSPNLEAVERESMNYKKITSGLSRGKFVNCIDFMPQAGSATKFRNQCALVLERGERDLKSFLGSTGALEGKQLRDAAAAGASCLQAIHSSRLVWTDMKTENFVVMENGEVKGIDLESAMPYQSSPVDYSPEACPPEFAAAFLQGDGPYFDLDFSYDVWSFGMFLYEIATGRGYFDGKKPAQITRALKDCEGIDVSDVADARLRDLISQCLNLNPKQRPGTAQILLHPYFLTTGFGSFSF